MAAEYGLKLEPSDRIIFANKKLGEAPVDITLKITNTTKDRCSFKVKCTSNELFRIRPPLGILRNGDAVTVTLTFNGGKTVPESGKHYVAIYYIKIGDEKKTARQFWQDHKGEPTGTKKLYMDFKKEDAGAAAAAAAAADAPAPAAADANNNDKKEDNKEKKEEDKKEEAKKEDDEKKPDAAADKKEDKKEEGKKEEDKDDKKDEKKEDDKKEEEKKEVDKKEDEKKEEKKE